MERKGNDVEVTRAPSRSGSGSVTWHQRRVGLAQHAQVRILLRRGGVTCESGSSAMRARAMAREKME